jgi:hypothetical protein
VVAGIRAKRRSCAGGWEDGTCRPIGFLPEPDGAVVEFASVGHHDATIIPE